MKKVKNHSSNDRKERSSKMKIRKIITAAVAAVSAVSSFTVPVSASEELYEFNYSIAAFEFCDTDSMEQYMSSVKGLERIEGFTAYGYEYLLENDFIYYPKGFTEDELFCIYVTPTYVCTQFETEDEYYSLKCYYSEAAAENKLETASDESFSAYGNDVYYEYILGETEYVWEQDGYVFALTADGEHTSSNRKMCTAKKQQLYLFEGYEKGMHTVNGKKYYVNKDGTYLKNGWKTIKGKRYFFGDDGAAVTKSTVIDGIRCKFSSSGVYLGRFTGRVFIGGDEYYYKNGIMQTGYVIRNGKTYFYGDDGILITAD